MSMSRKDYVAIAKLIHDAEPFDQDREGMVRKDVAEQFCDIAQADNPQFDRARFLKACGVAS